jgi:hypothetical protein
MLVRNAKETSTSATATRMEGCEPITNIGLANQLIHHEMGTYIT